jgi:hypothetical protein
MRRQTRIAPESEAHGMVYEASARRVSAGLFREGRSVGGCATIVRAAAFNVSNRLRRNASTMISSAVSFVYPTKSLSFPQYH